MADRKKPVKGVRKAPAVRKEKKLLIRSAGQVRALRTPLRQAIVEALTKLGTCTVRELADELRMEPAALYYHIHALVKAGIATEAGRREGGGRPERVYGLVAERIIIDRTETSKPFLSALSDLQCSTLRAAEREVAASIAASARARAEDPTVLLRLACRLKPHDAAHARRMLHDVVEFLAEHDDSRASETYSLTVALTRLVK